MVGYDVASANVRQVDSSQNNGEEAAYYIDGKRRLRHTPEMSTMKILLVLSVLVALAYGEQVTNGTESLDPEKPHPKPTTTTTTTVVPTTPSTTTTTSVPPTTTTPTTQAPNTTLAPTTTSTAAPPTTVKPSPPTSTTVKPTPPKPVVPTKGYWNVSYSSPASGMCIKTEMALQVEIVYTTTSNNAMTAYVDVPPTANATGDCGSLTQNLMLSWNGNNSVNFNFKLNNSIYHVDSIEITIIPDNSFININSTDPISLKHVGHEFNTTEKKSYMCDDQTLDLTPLSPTVVTANMTILHLQYQAFANSTGFAEAIKCKPIDTPDIIPIAAGIALGILIAFILIGYLVGRRRSQARGYLSMFTQTKREEDYIPMKNLSCFN